MKLDFRYFLSAAWGGSCRSGGAAADHRGGLYSLPRHRSRAAGAPASCAPKLGPRHFRGRPRSRRAVGRVPALTVDGGFVVPKEATPSNAVFDCVVPSKCTPPFLSTLKSVEQREGGALWIRYEVARP